MTSICEKKSSAKVRLIHAEEITLNKLNHSSKTFTNKWESIGFCKVHNPLQKFRKKLRNQAKLDKTKRL